MVRPVEVEKFKAPAPTYDRNAMHYMADAYDWVYEPREPFTKKDVVTPGHFNVYSDELRVGSRITCRLGKVQDGITEVELQVIECPPLGVKANPDRNINVIVSLGSSREFTPVRHDGTATKEKEKAA